MDLEVVGILKFVFLTKISYFGELIMSMTLIF